MPKFEVSVYNTIYFTREIEAADEDEAAQKLWENAPGDLDLPEGFSIGDPSAWEVDF